MLCYLDIFVREYFLEYLFLIAGVSASNFWHQHLHKVLQDRMSKIGNRHIVKSVLTLIHKFCRNSAVLRYLYTLSSLALSTTKSNLMYHNNSTAFTIREMPLLVFVFPIFLYLQMRQYQQN